MRGTEDQQSPPEMQSTTAARQANYEDYSFSLGREDSAVEPVRPESLRMRPATDFECRRARFSCFPPKPDENSQNPVILGFTLGAALLQR